MAEMIQEPTTRSRRALLAAAAGAAAATAAAAAATVVAPATTLASDPNDVVMNANNATTGVTTLTQGTTDTGAFEAVGNGAGVGVVGATTATTNAGVVGLAGDYSLSTYATHAFDLDSGVFGYSGSQTGVGTGVYGEGTYGLWGYGDVGVNAQGTSVGLYADAYPSGTAIHGHAGSALPPADLTLIALRGTVSTKTQVGLRANGRVQYPDRSGKTSIASGASKKTITVTGVRSGHYAFAVLNSARTGIYVRAVVPGTDKITIYLNKAVSSSTPVAWQVLG